MQAVVVPSGDGRNWLYRVQQEVDWGGDKRDGEVVGSEHRVEYLGVRCHS